MRAWHFVRPHGKLLDQRPVVVGETYVHTGKVQLCHSGLHASEHLRHALIYANGPFICAVECEDDIVHDRDKLVCSRRTVLAAYNATEDLERFAKWCGLQALDFWGDAPGLECVRAALSAYGPTVFSVEAYDHVIREYHAQLRRDYVPSARRHGLVAIEYALRQPESVYSWVRAWLASRHLIDALNQHAMYTLYAQRRNPSPENRAANAAASEAYGSHFERLNGELTRLAEVGLAERGIPKGSPLVP